MKSAYTWLDAFLREQTGLITVEWVALAGAVLIGGIAVIWIVINQLQAPASSVGSNLVQCEQSGPPSSGSTTGCQ